MKVVCFGDSNTYGFDPRSYFGGRYNASERWVDILAAKTGWQMINMGQNGLSIPCSEYEAELYDKIFLRESPDILIIMLGSNDLLSGLGADAVSGRMKRFISNLSLDKQKILLVSPPFFKPGLWVESERVIENSAALGEKYKSLAQNLCINFTDSKVWNVQLCNDGVHFTAAGHKAFAEGIYKTINKEIEKCLK